MIVHLDNVIWQALTTRLSQLGVRDRGASKFQADVSILGGLAEPSPDAYAALAGLLAPGERVGLFLDEAIATPELEIVSSVPLLQMTEPGRDVPKGHRARERGHEGAREAVTASGAGVELAIVPLTAADVPAMLALTELAKPGPFDRRTHELGDYLGLWLGGELVAMAGERLRVPGYTEVSAICTHPAHLGRGYAAALMAAAMERIARRGERAFLHVRPENERAVNLYERLGFVKGLRNRYVVLQRR